MDDNSIIKLINSSQIIDEDKRYWIDSLPKMSEDQKAELVEILTIKSKIGHAIAEINHALATIEEAEGETQDANNTEIDHTPPPSEDIAQKQQEVPQDTSKVGDLEKMKKDEEAKLQELRNQLQNLSEQV